MDKFLAAAVLALCAQLATPQGTKAADLRFLKGIWTQSEADCRTYLDTLPVDKIDLRQHESSFTLITDGRLRQYVDGEGDLCKFGAGTARRGETRAALTCSSEGYTFDSVKLRVRHKGRRAEFKWSSYGTPQPVTQSLYHCRNMAELSRRFSKLWSLDHTECSATAHYAYGSVTFKKETDQNLTLIVVPTAEVVIPKIDFAALVTIDDMPPIQRMAAVNDRKITIPIGPFESRAKAFRDGFEFRIEEYGELPEFLYLGAMPLLGSGKAMKFLERCVPKSEPTAEDSSSPAATGSADSLPFVGSWISVESNIAKHCNDDNDGLITIRNDAISVWEGRCDIVDVNRTSPETWNLKLSCGQEDESYPVSSDRFIFINREEVPPEHRLVWMGERFRQTYKRCPPSTTEASNQDFEPLPSVDLPGGDYRTIKQTTLDICKASCATQDRCVAFTYNRNAKWCFLKSEVNTSQPVRFATSGLKLVSSENSERADQAIIRNWHLTNGFCRGGPGDEETLAWCDVRDAYMSVLYIRNWCFGHEDDEAAYQQRWHKCGPGSLRENSPLTTAAFELDGSFISKSRSAIPSFPLSVPGFYSATAGEDFWGKPYEDKGSLRVFEGSDWTGLPDFPSTQNGCSSGRFMIRWRSANPDVAVTAALFFAGETIAFSESGSQGYLIGSNCHQPRFKFLSRKPGNQSTLTDIYYEVQFWRERV